MLVNPPEIVVKCLKRNKIWIYILEYSIQSARYGRMRFGGCLKENHGHIGCSADVINHLDRVCSGRHTCIMSIPDATLHKIQACPKELMPYLEAKYSCVKGAYTSQH